MASCAVRAGRFHTSTISASNAAIGTTTVRRSYASVPPEKATSAVDSKAEDVSSNASPAPPDIKQSSDSSNTTSGSGGGRRADGISSSGARSSSSGGGFMISGGVFSSVANGDGITIPKLIRSCNWRQILQHIRSSNKPVSSDQLRAIMRPAARAGQSDLVRAALKQLTDAGLATSQDWACLMHAHVAARNLHDAELTLGEMVASGHKPEMAVFHAVLRAKAKDMHRGGASVVLRLMSQCSTPPDLAAYNLALRACRGGNAVLHADKILADMAAAGLAADRHTFRGMLHACKQAHDWERALAVFHDVEARHPAFVDADMWNCLLDALSVCGQPQAVLAAAARMAERGVAPAAVAYMVLVKAHAELGDGAAVEATLSSMRAAGFEVTAVALFTVAQGYAHGGHVEAAEEALEAAFRSSGSGAAATAAHARAILGPEAAPRSSGSGDAAIVTAAHTRAILAFMGACRRERDLPRAVRWLRRLPLLGVAPSPRIVQVVVNVAHDAGDAAAADALWREAGGAAYFGLYKALVPPKKGGRGGWTVLMDHPVRRPHAQSTALDVSTCNDSIMHVALRAEAERLRTRPPPATAYIYGFIPSNATGAAAFHALVGNFGMHVSAVPRTSGLFKASVGAQKQTK